ncbi:MAG: hypothetical protein C0467_00440 [Planctomycetaceae bacterium]|nr:hypothetical protein [Planctomycetaceae bacterium]
METTNDPALTTPLATLPVVINSANAQLPAVPGYEVLALVGRGGMGRVYRARHQTLGRVVALKLLTHEPNERLLARFREEVRAVATLQHPNIAQLFETGVIDGQPYFTQEFLDGGSLSQSFDRKPQEPLKAAGIVETIARAIQHSHDHNILHRDLKPANILLASDGAPKVTDFGLAKTIPTLGEAGETAPDAAGLTHTGEILGTPAYMPPEQASGVLSLIGPPADVYGIGAILYEALTGRPPFLGPDAIRTVIMVREMEPVSPRTLQPDVPRDLETICLKCLAKEPHKRYASAGELAEDLRRFQNREPIYARPVGTWERTAKWARRKPWQAAVAALIVASVVGLAVGLALLSEKNRLVRQANSALEATNAELTASLAREERANAELTIAKNKAEAETKRAEATLGMTLRALNLYYFQFSDKLKHIPQAEKLRLEVITQARGTLDELSKFQPDNWNLQQNRMEGYDRLGNIESQLGNTSASEADYAKSRDLAIALAARYPDEPGYRANRLHMTAKIASLQIRKGDLKGADALVDAILPDVTALVAAHPEHPGVMDMEDLVRQQLLMREIRLGRWDGAETRMKELGELYRRRAKIDSDNPNRILAVIDSDRQLAQLQIDLGKLDPASESLLAALRSVAALKEPLTVEGRKLRAIVNATTGTYFQARNAMYPAFISFVAALRDYDSLVADFPDLPFYSYQRAETLWYLAVTASSLGDQPLAVRYLERSEKLLAVLTRDYPSEPRYRSFHERLQRLLKLPRPTSATP